MIGGGISWLESDRFNVFFLVMIWLIMDLASDTFGHTLFCREIDNFHNCLLNMKQLGDRWLSLAQGLESGGNS